ncbi:MAG: hypothetical protein QN198_05420 [Armatimonadota bacterium]|nr:hypothetical protein [Armatimonadota bacterium]MDR5703026.1 hypothetical protein [Armatimonadota bacterium]MDR7434200.1 hypothetical protein [Armatimonadota bacterium]
MGRPTAFTVFGAFLILTAVVTVVYWIVFFTSEGIVQTRTDEVYLAFERAFPLADAWLVVASALAARGLLRADSSGLLWSLLAGSSLIYLGLMDILFNLENGIYTVLSSSVAIEIVINAFCVIFGPVLIAGVWSRRQLLLSGSGK